MSIDSREVSRRRIGEGSTTECQPFPISLCNLQETFGGDTSCATNEARVRSRLTLQMI